MATGTFTVLHLTLTLVLMWSSPHEQVVVTTEGYIIEVPTPCQVM